VRSDPPEPSGGVAHPLRDVRVVDCSVALPGSFCTSLLQQFGAEVTLIEDSRGRPLKAKSSFRDEHLSLSPTYYRYLSRGKKVISADLTTAEGRDCLRQSLYTADVLVEDWREGLFDETGIDRDEILQENPDLVIVSVTPYGRSGPRSGWPASDLTLLHGAGPGHATPGLVADPKTMPPLRMASHQGALSSGLAAAINVCAAVFLRRRNGSGIPLSVDFSCHEAVANNVRQNVGTFAFYGGGLNRDLARGRGAGGTAEHRNIRCKDGWINMVWAGPQHWDSVGELLGRPEWMEDERLATPGLRYKNWALVLPRLEEWAQQYEKDYLFYVCQGHRIPCAPVNDGPDLLEADVLDSRAYWDRESEGAKHPMPGRINRMERADE
jgi:crotonobetainyl-CoA:carnitine CoA-transferase CaiB-like acyl-CoA transferase